MRYRVATLLLFVLLGGCGGLDGKKFSVAFRPYSSELDPRAQATVHDAAAFATAHPLVGLSIAGYGQRPDQGDIDTLRQLRVGVVHDALIKDGVGPMRIEILGNGILYPNGVPNLPTDQVDINVGL